MSEINGLVGYMHSDVSWEKMVIVTEIETKGNDSDGYEGKQTLGLAETQFNDYVLFTGSIDSTSNHCSTIFFGDGVELDNIPGLLRQLADQIESI